MMNKMMKKAMIVFAAASIAASSLSAVPALANDGTNTVDFSVSAYNADVYVTASSANIRTEPSTNGRILKVLENGTPIHITGVTNNGWYSFDTSDPKFGGETAGYIRSDLVGSRRQNPERQGLVVGNCYSTHVNSGYLALRNACSYDESNEIGPLWNGSEVIVTGAQCGDYVPVRVTYCAGGEYGSNLAGYTGYVNAGCLR